MDSKQLFNKPEIRFQNLNQGIFDGKFYFGRVVYLNGQPTDSVISSNSVCFVDFSKCKTEKNEDALANEIQLNGLMYRNGLIDMGNHWSNYSVAQFLEGNATVINPKELFLETSSIFEKFMDVHDPRILSLTACYTMATYCFSLFNAFGYLFFNCEKETGKTKFMRLMEFTSFNGINATNPTESSLFRICDSMHPTMLVDDYENLDDDRQKVINQILKVGYKKGGQTFRMEKFKDNFKPVIFDFYCPKVISNTTELDHIMLTRCIVIRLIKTKTEKGKLEPDENDPFWQEIRDKQYLFVMQNWQKIQELYQNYQSTKFNNRNLELVKGILSVAKIIGQDVHDEIESFLEESFDDRDFEVLQSDWRYILFRSLSKNVIDERDYTVGEISEWCKEEILPEKPEGSRKKWIGGILSKIPLFKKVKDRKNKGITYRLSPQLIKEYFESRGWEIPTAETSPSTQPLRKVVEGQTVEEMPSAIFDVCKLCNIQQYVKFKVLEEPGKNYCEECVKKYPLELASYV